MPRNDIVLCVPDLHLPFWDIKAVKKMLFNIHKHKPTHIIQLGDLYDFYSFTRFDRTFNLMTPADEVKRGRELAEWFWAEVKKRAPDARCYQLMGNHDIRPYTKLMKVAPEMEQFFDLSSCFIFDGVKTIVDDDLILTINGQRVLFAHGFYTRPGQHLNANRISTVFAHTHLPWCIGSHLLGAKALFELNCGFLGDHTALPFSYANQRRIQKWIKSYGLIDKFGPRVIYVE